MSNGEVTPPRMQFVTGYNESGLCCVHFQAELEAREWLAEYQSFRESCSDVGLDHSAWYRKFDEPKGWTTVYYNEPTYIQLRPFAERRADFQLRKPQGTKRGV